VASQVQVGNLQAGLNAGIAAETLLHLKDLGWTRLESEDLDQPIKVEPTKKVSTPQLFSHSVEFVALPGRTEKICKEIPAAMRQANTNSAGFSGCIVLISEQEARLITVITLWNGIDSANGCDESLDQLKRLLEPHVDSWMRTRKFISFLSVP
jgi:hypothetical protein